MRPRAISLAVSAACALVAARAGAQPAAPAAENASTADPASVWSPELIVATRRFGFPEPDPRGTQLGLHGEAQLRLLGATDLPLDPPIREPSGDAAQLGQNVRLESWLRLRARMDFEDTASIHAEGDLRFFTGDSTRFVSAARDPFNEEGLDLDPRQLYLELRTPVGVLRVGQQTSSWGMGLVANGGDTPSFFGDYRGGDRVERILFATRPGGADHPFLIALAGDLVFEDDTASLADDDRALQAVLAVAWRDDSFDLGVYGVVRHHDRDRASVYPSPGYTENLTVAVIDVAGGFHGEVPGAQSFVYGQFEVAAVLGETDFVRTGWSAALDPADAADVREDVQQLGGAARLGIVHLSHAPHDRVLANGAVIDSPHAEGAPWGDLAVEVEVGWASGDADPADGKSRRFVFDESHNVGLVLFDHLLAWKTARAATNGQDPRVVGRAPPGIDLLASDGGVFGATYLNPRVVGRPARWMDLKLGVVIAQTTSDVVDPYRFGALGSATNWDGGDANGRDLGVEFDAGVDVAVPVGDSVTGQIGAEGGVLLPGGAFDDEAGNRLPVQALAQGKVGIQF